MSAKIELDQEIVHKTKPSIAVLRGDTKILQILTYDNISDSSPTFSGVVIDSNSKERIEQVGYYSSNWSKPSFKFFTGTVTIACQ
jgi:hypothetical protein